MKRKNAAVYAMENGVPTLTEEIQLLQVSSKEPGFLFILPVYKTDYVPEIKSDRIKNILGWTFAPVLFSKVFEDYQASFSQPIKYQVTDITNKEQAQLLKSNSSDFQNPYEEVIQIGQRNWLIRTEFLNDYDLRNVKVLSVVFFSLTLIIYSFFVFYLKNQFQSFAGYQSRAIYAEEINTIIIKNTNLSVITTTPLGIITTFNTGAEKMLGYQAEELVDKFTPAVFHDIEEVILRASELSNEFKKEIKPGFDVFVLKALKYGADSNEWTYVKKDGIKLTVRLSVSPLFDTTNTLLGYVGIAEDISSQKKLSQIIENQKIQLIQSTKMTSLGEMAGGVAHEINTPLTVIFNKSKKIRRSLNENNFNKTELVDELIKIESTVDKIAKIISGLKTFSRNSDKDDFVLSPLTKIVEDTLTLCQERFKFENINLEVSVATNIQFSCRPSQISQVLLNLLNNAFDAVLLAQVKWVNIRVKEEEKYIQICISNSGEKIPPHIHNKLMEPFFTTKEIGKGTGLGLSISKGIIEEHGGKLFFDTHSEYTTFIVELPLSHVTNG